VSTFDQRPDGASRSLPPRLDPRAGRPTRPGSPNAPSHGARRPRTSPLAITARLMAAVLAVVVLGGSGWGWYLTQVAEASVNRTDAIPTDGNTDTSGHGEAMNILLVADDSRDNLTAAQRKQLLAFDDGGSLNTDTMMLVHVPADGSAASFVSFPRDSFVQIPGHGSDKLNAAYADGYTTAPKSEPEAQRKAAGQQLLIQTISQLTGLQIDHFVSVDMLGFFTLSNVVGGVEVNVCKATYDDHTGARFPAGVQTITGTQALLFVRQRHGLPGGDLDRVRRQQVFIAGVARKLLSEKVMLNPATQRKLVEAVGQSLTVDQTLDIMQLAQQMQKVTAGGVNFQTLPMVGFAKDPKAGDIVKLPSTSTLHTFFADLGTSTATGPAAGASAAATSAAPKPVPPAKVKTQVFNGSGTAGLAASAAAALQAKGFVVSGTGNADAATYTKTEIRYAEGDESLAATLAAQFPGATTTVRDDATSGTVQVVLGSDFTAVGQPLKVTATTPAAATSTPRTAADTGCIN
jgi:LCP family protein required for cell wall assembly